MLYLGKNRQEKIVILLNAEKEAKKVSKDGDSSINSIHEGSDGNRENAVKIVLDAFRTN